MARKRALDAPGAAVVGKTYELHEQEQYFFAPQTADALARFAGAYSRVCCLCAPMVGQRLEELGSRPRTLDLDERFAHLQGFRRYDLYRPEWLEQEFDLILCDPPFFRVSLSQLFTALRVLSHGHYDQKLMIAYLWRRTSAVVGSLSRFGVQPTGIELRYRTVQTVERNRIELFTNLSGDEVEALRSLL